MHVPPIDLARASVVPDVVPFPAGIVHQNSPTIIVVDGQQLVMAQASEIANDVVVTRAYVPASNPAAALIVPDVRPVAAGIFQQPSPAINVRSYRQQLLSTATSKISGEVLVRCGIGMPASDPATAAVTPLPHEFIALASVGPDVVNLVIRGKKIDRRVFPWRDPPCWGYVVPTRRIYPHIRNQVHIGARRMSCQGANLLIVEIPSLAVRSPFKSVGVEIVRDVLRPIDDVAGRIVIDDLAVLVNRMVRGNETAVECLS